MGQNTRRIISWESLVWLRLLNMEKKILNVELK